MNNDQRKRLKAAVAALGEINFDEIKSTVEDCHAEEEEKFENLSEGLQQGEKGQAIEQARDALERAKDALDEIDLEDIINSIEEAINS